MVTTAGPGGEVNLAPMGPTVNDPITRITLRPFRSSRTYANLKPGHSQYSGKAVVHVTDDVMLFARAAVDAIDPEQVKSLVTEIELQGTSRLKDCHRWFAVVAENFVEDDLRATIDCQIVESGVVRPFFGFNRAKHAVIEAAILATRAHLISPDEMLTELDRLRVMVDKTAGDRERQAFDFLTCTIDDRIAANG